MKVLAFVCLVALMMSCNDGGSEPQDFVKAQDSARKQDSLKFDSVNHANAAVKDH